MTKNISPDNFNKYIAIVLVFAIIAAVGVYAYKNFVEKEPLESENNNNTSPIVGPADTVLTISVGSQ